MNIKNKCLKECLSQQSVENVKKIAAGFLSYTGKVKTIENVIFLVNINFTNYYLKPLHGKALDPVAKKRIQM